MTRSVLLVPSLFVLACVSGSDERPATRSPVPWERADVRPELRHPLFEDREALADLALFAERHVGPEDGWPDPSHRGAYAVGNGRVAALMGLDGPTNTLHGLVGPTYRTRGRFFGDLALRPRVDGVEVAADTAWIARPRGTGLVVTRTDAGPITVYTVDVAPRPAGVDPLEVPPVLLRFVAVTTTEDRTVVDLSLDAADTFAPDPEAGGVLASLLESGTRMGLVALDGAWEPAGTSWTLPVGEVTPATPALRVLALPFADDGPALETLVASLADVDAEVWLDDTLAWWAAWSATGLQLELDDPWLLDLVDGLRVQVRLQQSAAGGVVPLSRYTGTWLRDTIGPARFFSRLGLTDEVASMVTYLELCHRLRGDLGNSCTSGLVPAEVPFALDWSTKTAPFVGRTSAEGPSHVPLAFEQLTRWTGDWQVALDHQAYLHRAMAAQTVSPEGWQRWSGDETYRLAMEVALGYPLETAWDTKAFSSASSHLYVPAARFVADVDERAGLTGDADDLRARADLVHEGALAFVQPAGHFAAVKVDDADLPPTDRPFEDSALQALWTGAYAPDDPVALDALAGLRLAVDQGDGTFQSPASDPYTLAGPYVGGVCTGMLPGFVLWNLAVTGAPDHPDAFDQVLSYATPSGEFVEGQVYEDRAALQVLYSRTGGGDVAARYRPWEGGIVGDAVVAWLVGAEPLGTLEDPILRLRPRLPSGLSHLAARGVRALGAVVDVELTWDEGTWRVALHNLGDTPLAVDLEVPLEVWEDVAVDGQGPTGEPRVRTLPLGERYAAFPRIGLSAGASVEASVTPR